MIKKRFLLWCLCSPVFSMAQNVGIGTATPTEKLEVKNPIHAFLKISSNDFVDTTALVLSNRNTFNQGTDILFKSMRESGLVISSSSDIPSANKDSLFSILINGNVGIGKRIPFSRLHIHDALSTTSNIAITNATSGSGPLDGLYIGLSNTAATIGNLENGTLRFSTNNNGRLMIDSIGRVGIGTMLPNYVLDVNGDINLTGRLLSKGNVGVAGQVLTSNGTGTGPSWQTINTPANISCNVGLTTNFVGTGQAVVPFNAETGMPFHDDGNLYNTTNHYLETTTAGVYHFDISLQLAAPPAGLYSLYLSSDATGSAVYAYSTQVVASGTSNGILQMSITIKLPAASKMYVLVFRPASMTIPLTAGTFFSAYRLY